MAYAFLLSLAELLGDGSVVFSFGVVPALDRRLAFGWYRQALADHVSTAWLCSGGVRSAVLTLADRLSTRRLFAVSALLAALVTGLIPLLATGLLLPSYCVPYRLFLAGVYPVGMKIITTWTRIDRGLGIGCWSER